MSLVKPVNTLVEMLMNKADSRPDLRAYTFLADGERQSHQITRGALDTRARSIAAALQEVTTPGDRALMLFSPGIDFVAAFFGCLYAGVIAVPCVPPSARLTSRDAKVDRFLTVANDCEAVVTLTSSDVAAKMHRYTEKHTTGKELQWVSTDLIPDAESANWCAPSIAADTLAYLQYTSGSTGAPKGVMVSHRNLLHNMGLLQRAAHIPDGAGFVSWLPVYHDMGLISMILQSQVVGGSCTFMAPVHFVQRPLRWLEAITRAEEEQVVSASPNFGYNLCVSDVQAEDLPLLDLSRWSVCINGAEPIRQETLNAFTDKFKVCGFKSKTFFPGYGLAEATLAVTLKAGEEIKALKVDGVALENGQVQEATATAAQVRTVVSVGTHPPDQQVLVVHPRNCTPCDADQVGEIWLAGPSICQGYWGKPQETAQSFQAQLDTGEGPFLRTGDLGFIHQGELYVSSRLKDLIIIRGRNFYPHDIEATAGAYHPSLKVGIGAAFAVDVDGEERLVVAQAVDVRARENWQLLAEEIRQAIMDEHDVEPHAVLLVKPSDIPRTTSGKIQRGRCRTMFLNGEIEPLAGVLNGKEGDNRGAPTIARGQLLTLLPEARREAVERYVLELVGRLLRTKLTPADASSQLIALGMDSLRTIELRNVLEGQLGVALPMASSISAVVDAVLQQFQSGELAATLPAVRVDRQLLHEPFPLTDIQHAYFVGRSGALELGNVSTHAYWEVETEGLDLPRLTVTWQRLLERHDMLRAVVRPDGSQVILEQVPTYVIQEADVRGQAPEAVEAQIDSVRNRLSAEVRPADQWPLFEICATRLTDSRVRLHLSFDMLIMDVWSFRVLFDEWARLYREPNMALPSLELSFRDYVLAAEQLEQTQAYQRAQRYWLDRLPTLPPPPELPLAKAPGTTECPAFMRRTGRLEAERWQRLKSMSAQLGLTPSGTLLALFARVLAAWSKSQRFTLNVTLFNRLPLHQQVNQLVGDFTSTNLLEVDLTTPAGVAAYGVQIQKQLWRDLEHSSFSGVRVLRELARLRETASASVPIVFTSALGQGRGESDDLPLDWMGNQVYGISQTPQVWLDHQLYERGGDLVFTWDSVDELFPAGMLDDMFAAYNRSLQELVDRPELWTESHHDWLPEEQRTVREMVNATAGLLPEALLQAGFVSRAAANPDEVAVVAADRTLTYGELYRRANQVGRQLRHLGVKPNTLVAVAIEKSWEQIVAVLGILQAGAAYLPVGPDLPEERQAYLLEHGQVKVAVTRDGRPLTASWRAGLHVVAVDQEGWEGEQGDPLDQTQGPDDLAYVLYTSGSTGLPKGVAISHRAALNTVADINERFCVTADDAVLALSALSFDLSVYDIFGLLGAGGKVVVPEPGALREPRRWMELIQMHRVTVWNSVPALMEMLADAATTERTALPLRLVLMSGDWIPTSLPDRVRHVAQDVQVISLGGATEAGIWSIAYPIEQVDTAWESIPYGRPLRNQRFAVLNDRLDPCPVWVTGHLCIAGAGLARGYWGDPEKTAGSFITHPLTGERLYRTGDLGRYLPDGTIEFLGREDFQVKIRGYRVELGEIESAVAQHPKVRTAAVVAAGSDRTNRRLVAFVVPRAEGDASNPYTALAGDLFGQTGREGAIFAPAERLDFKLKRPGLRTDCLGAATQLAEPAASEEITRICEQRISRRTYLQTPLPLQTLSTLLGALRSRETEVFPRHLYGSAGGLYPVQTYIWVKDGRIEGLAPGTYYYDPRGHRLLLIQEGAVLTRALHVPMNYSVFEESAFSIFMVGQMKAIEPLYRQKSRDFCLIEAGLMTQLLELTAAAGGMGLCQTGVLKAPEMLRELLALDDGHVLLHSLVGGAVPSGRSDTELASGNHQPGGEQALLNEISTAIGRKLPGYMVPQQFIVLQELPLSATGKVDRKRLAQMADQQAAKVSEYVAPRNEVEGTLVEVLQQVFKVEQIGIHDNFFDLGADSLTVARAYNRIRLALGKEFPLLTLYHYPNVSLLTAHLTGAVDETLATREGLARGQRQRDMRSQRQQIRIRKG